jgi:hypothetical protein
MKEEKKTFVILNIYFFSLINTGKETLKDHQQQIKNEIARARVALSGPLRRK